jgi:hypothetical protein
MAQLDLWHSQFWLCALEFAPMPATIRPSHHKC